MVLILNIRGVKVHIMGGRKILKKDSAIKGILGFCVLLLGLSAPQIAAATVLTVDGGSVYTLGSGSINPDAAYVGYSGVGVFNHTGGTNTVAGEMMLARGSASNGTYNLSAGSLSAINQYIAYRGTGAFIQSGGTNTAVNGLTVAYANGSNGSYELISGSVSAAREFIGANGIGTFTQSGGTNTIRKIMYVGYDSDGTGIYDLSGSGALSTVDMMVGYVGDGTFNQSGGTSVVSDTLTVAANAISSGAYNLSGGELSATELINNGTFTYSGGTLTADVTNNGYFHITGGGTRTVYGDFTNTVGATLKSTDTIPVFTGVFTNNGAYISDPTDNYFLDLIVSASGHLEGGVGDNWYVSGDFENNSEQDALWDTSLAYLGFTGAGGHDFTLASVPSPWDFSWGILELLDAGVLTLYGSDLYVDELILGAGTILNLNGATIYYNTLTDLGGMMYEGIYTPREYLLGDRRLVVTPEPATWLLMGGGIAGLAAWRRRRSKKAA